METAVKQDTITVTFNGEDDVVKYHPHQKVEVVLKQALDHFEVQQNRHLMSLFTEAGAELTNEQLTLEEANIKAGAVLILRPSAVKGG
jgi:hypothetical protein